VRERDLALDEGLGVAQELEVHRDVVLVDPLARELLHAVGDVAQRGEAGLDGVVVGVAAEQRDHLVGLTADGGEDGGLAGEVGLVDVGLGGGVGGGALDEAGLGDADLHAGDVGADDVGEDVAGAAELGVAEGVGLAVSGEVVAVGIDEALGDDDGAELLALEDALHVLEDLGLVERDLGEEDDVRGVVRVVAALGEGGAGGDPAGAAAHDLDDGDEVALTHGLAVAGDFAHGRGEVLDHAAVAGAVVGDGEVIVDRLRHADHAELVALLLGELGDLVGGVLGVVAPDVEEIADVVGLEDLEDALEIGLFLELVATGAEGGAGGVLEGADLLLRLGGEIDQVLVQDAEHPVEAAVDFLNAFMVQRFGDDAGDAGVDDGGGATGLAHQNIAYEFSHDRIGKGLREREGTQKRVPVRGGKP